MRRPVLALAIIAVALLVAACAGSAPGWTFAPPTIAPPSQAAPSGEASAVPSEAAPSAGASAAPSDGAGGGATVDISALNVEFEQTEVSAPAGAPFVIHFNNKDQGIPHDIEIKDGSGAVVFKGDLVTGVAEVDYQVPALAAGSYPFICTVHPNMTGTIKAGG